MEQNPISKLLEICTKNGIAHPSFIPMECTGPPHQRSFSVCCNMITWNYKTQGIGTSIKEAKKCAAGEILNLIARDHPHLLNPTNPNPSFQGEPVNHVGRLQELCMKERFQFPKYTFSQSVGPDNIKAFIALCRVSELDLEAQAEGKTLKEAKKLAAKLVIQGFLEKITQPNYASLKRKAEMTVIKNPICILNELCSKAKIPMPIYTTVDSFHSSMNNGDGGTLPQHFFSLICSIPSLGIKEQGNGSSKKEAKRNAAMLLLTKHNLKETLQDNTKKMKYNYNDKDYTMVQPPPPPPQLMHPHPHQMIDMPNHF